MPPRAQVYPGKHDFLRLTGGVDIRQYMLERVAAPAAARYVTRMGFDDKAFAAAIVSMAVKGYLTIEEDSRKTYTLT